MRKIYLDNAATTPIASEVIDVISKTMKEVYGNPSSTHQFGRKAKSLVEQSRKNIAKQFGVTASEIVFTAGGTEADNLVLRNAVEHLNIKRIITSKIEHHAVLHTVLSLQECYNIVVEYVALDDLGNVDLNSLDKLLSKSDAKTLVSLMHVNNEIGTILDLRFVSNLCKDYNALFHTDSVQSIGHYPVDLKDISLDFLVASAHKFNGPKGVGFAFFRKGFGIKQMITGGEQERGVRAGTENVYGILGMEKALALNLADIENDIAYVSNLKKYFIDELKSKIKNIAFNSPIASKSSYAILNVRLPKDIPMLLFNLDLKGIAASGGSACQSGSNKGSHVLMEVLPTEEIEKTSVRFSLSKLNTKDEIDYVITILRDFF